MCFVRFIFSSVSVCLIVYLFFCPRLIYIYLPLCYEGECSETVEAASLLW